MLKFIWWVYIFSLHCIAVISEKRVYTTISGNLLLSVTVKNISMTLKSQQVLPSGSNRTATNLQEG